MFALFVLSTILSANADADTTAAPLHEIDEVVVVTSANDSRRRSLKGQTASIDEHLSELSRVNLVRRGSYAWEPVVNNMTTERVSTTIDGMKIFYACTDKMDPVTSYVESGNLQSISLNSGLNGNPQSTGNIGGSLDLKLRKVGFDSETFVANASAGYEANGHLQVYGADAAISTHRFYTNFGLFYRHADNYRAGDGHEVDFSQFQKVNTFANVGLRTGERDIIEATAIFDRATDVGYPALNMDVAKAEGIITSLSHRHEFADGFIRRWETKAYYNHITHIMDDTKRPDVAIHMDMPGESWTAGLYSLISANGARHEAQLNYDIYYNRVFADMTMYPGGAAPMYMVTWPDVGTLCTGLAASDDIAIGHNQHIHLSAKVAQQWQRLNDEEGYHALKVFFPHMTDAYVQTIGRIAASYAWQPAHWNVTLGAGWGSRAPTVTEAYGYYLNNTFDQYDYIGNPHLSNESAVELNASARWTEGSRLTIGVEGNAFLFSDYIIGQFEDRLSAMTVGAEGVKVYGNLSHATIANASFNAQWQATDGLAWRGKLGYSLGRDDEGDPLPLISPVAYALAATYSRSGFMANAELKGNARQVDFGPKYGETETPAYAVVNLSAQYALAIKKTSLVVRVGVENLLDKAYTTYADWREIPQKGRNVYANVAVTF